MKTESSKVDLNGTGLKIAILLPRFNDKIGLKLYEKTFNTLVSKKVPKKNIKLFRIPGSLELPLAAKKISARFDAVIALGVIIKGETNHFTHVCRETYRGLMQVQLETKTPTILGILTVKNIKQAEERIAKGEDYALAAIEMAHFMKIKPL